VDEARIEAERDVVQEETAVHACNVDRVLAASERAQSLRRIAALEPEVARDVVEGAERNGDERHAPLDRDLRDGRQRTVPAGHAHGALGRPPRDLSGVVAGAEDVRVEAEAGCRLTKLVGAGPAAGARVDDEKAAHRVSIDHHPPKGAFVKLIERIDAARERWNVLEHPFYKRWSCGELTRDELAHYAGAYRHAVVALADTAKKTGNEEHAREEAEHVILWDEFAAAFAATTDAQPSAETAECVRAWTAPKNRREALAVMYAIEAGQPAVSQAKLDGLADHYGVAADQPGAEYFALHSERDHDHAAQSRAELVDGEDADRLVEVAEAALRGNWTLLDGVDTTR
jgi:pyrroloquinoline-quinone synthase